MLQIKIVNRSEMRGASRLERERERVCLTNSSLKQRVSCMGKSEIGKIGSLSRTHFMLWVKQRIKIV